ncbi:MAG: AAA family ATPase [Chloroflexi bacterium]|nr:AAA family ATPase [Chloroflexota bacterium]
MTSERVQRQVDRLLTEAEDAMARGDWETVRLRAGAVLRLQPRDEDALTYLSAAGSEPAGGSTLPPSATAARPAERRHMAVMFCDLRGSTELSERMDPEDLRDVLRAYHRVAADAVDRLGGYISRYMGDGLLVYFGYPTAHEDDPDRAVRAGLEIVAAAAGLPLLPHGGVPEVRVGIHYGLAVIAEMGGGSRIEPNDVVGETANIAARIQSLAPPSAVVVSGELAALLRHPPQMERLGLREIKGISRPIELFRVAATGGTSERTRQGEGPLVGRSRELRLLESAWASALAGEGSAVLVSGDAGLGKTRLASELRRRARADGHTVIQLRGSPFHQNTALRPIVDHLARVLELDPATPGEEMLRRLEESLAGLGLEPRALVPPLAALLGLPNAAGVPGSELSGAELKEAIFETLAAWLRAVVLRAPTLVIVEDLHWLDPSSAELLLRIAGQVGRQRILILLTSRPEPGVARATGKGIVQITLQRLEPETTLELITTLAEGSTLAAGEIERLAGRSDGVPLFAEELVRLALEGGAPAEAPGRQAPRESNVPPALFSSLMARLDRMGPVRELARVAAVCGREVPVPLLAAAAGVPEAEARAGLEQLTEAGICMPLPGAGVYAFKHALIMDVAYESMLRADRVGLHGTIAGVIETAFPAISESEPEVLAHHLERAGAGARAIPYLRRAAARAVAQSANTEAVNHLGRALSLLDPAAGSAALELELRNALGPPLIATVGYSSPAVEENYGRATEVSRLLADPGQSFQALSGLRRFHQVHGDVPRARSISEELVKLADGIGEPVLRGIAHHALGEAFFLGGEPGRARTELEAARTILDACRADGVAAARDPSVTVRAYLGLTYWALGHPNLALATVSEAVAVAVEVESLFGTAYALVLSAWIHELRGEPLDAIRCAEAGRAVALEHRFPYWVHGATVYGAWARAVLGDADGLAEFIRGLEGFRAIGARTTEAHLLALLAEMKAIHEGPASAIEAIEEGFAAANESGELQWLPDLYRLRAGFRLQLDPADRPGALADIETALSLARESGARSLELRAAVTFATVCLAIEPPGSRGVIVLREAIDAFPEESPSPQLDAARELLVRLSSTPGTEKEATR